MKKVIFKNHYIQNPETGKKCKVWYSLNNRGGERNHVTIYAKTCLESMSGIIDFRNDTDMMTDYFEKDRAVIFEDNELYADALAAAQKGINDSKKSRFKHMVKKHGFKKALEYGYVL